MEPMEFLTDLVTTVPEGTSPAKVDELRAQQRLYAPLSSPKKVIWYAFGARRLVQAKHWVIPCRRRGRASGSPGYRTTSCMDEGYHLAVESTS
jgi:hypothetical protein